MRYLDAVLPELDLEMRFTRKHLERVPMDKLELKPHERSMTLGWLATFIAILPTWGTMTLTTDAFDVAPPGAPPPKREIMSTSQALLALFDKNVAELRGALAKVREEQFEQPWSLKAAGNVLFTQPRHLVFRTFFFNHMIHHRAQLGVFLRLAGAKVPAVYQDSADESGGIFTGG